MVTPPPPETPRSETPRSESRRPDPANRDPAIGAARRAAGRRARRLGRRGERRACRGLKRHGYVIHARNLRTPCGEIDILAEEGRQIVLVEVKTTARPGGAPAQAPLGHAQRGRLQEAARWLRQRPGFRGRRLRIDVVMVTLDAGRFVVTIRREAVRL